MNMSLKTYLSIKFIVYVFVLITVVFLSSSIANENRDLKNKKEVLLKQKSIYEKILKLSDKDVQAKKNLYEFIKVSDSELKGDSRESVFSISRRLDLLIINLAIWFYVINFLNKKIDKLKSKESGIESQQML
jgi:hypothetical protein